jgi:hypothetical protein
MQTGQFRTGKEIMLRVAEHPNVVPWQRLANERLEVANKLARVCAVLAGVLVVLGINSFSVMSEQSRMCESLKQAYASMDQYQARKLPTTEIVQDFCS